MTSVCSSADAERYCKQCAKSLCQQCLHQHNKWIKDHQTLGLEEVVDAAYQLPRAKPEVPSNCADHSEPVKIFCETCEELICHLCTVKKHRDHDYDVITDGYTEQWKQKLESAALQPLNQPIAQLTEAVANLLKRREEIVDQGERVSGEIHHEITRIKELLDQAEKELNEEANVAVKYKLEVTDHQTKEAKAVLGQLTECRDHVQQSLKVGTPHQILTTKSQLTSRSKNLIAEAENKVFEPLEQADMEFVIKGDIVGSIGKIYYNSSKVSVNSAYQHIPLVGQQSTITVSLSLPDGTPAPVPCSLIRLGVTPPDSNKLAGPIQCTIKDSPQAGQYSVTFTPNTRGVHQLHATTTTIHNRIIPGSPMSIPVSVPPRMRGTLVKTIGTGLNIPTGIAVTDGGQVIVSERDGHCITVLDKYGGRVKSFGTYGKGKGQLAYPEGVAITSKGTILVVDGGNNCVQEFTMDGKCVSCVGGRGDGPIQFYDPVAIAINRTTGQVCVVDCDNHRVQVLNADLTFSHMFGSRGSGPGQFKNPRGVGIDSQGFVYVVDADNNRIQQFTAEGKWLSSFGSEPGRLTYPRDITVDDYDLLYVCEGSPNRRVSVFTTTGHFVCCFGKGTLGYPQRSAFDKNGCLCVSDRDKKHIEVF